MAEKEAKKVKLSKEALDKLPLCPSKDVDCSALIQDGNRYLCRATSNETTTKGKKNET